MAWTLDERRERIVDAALQIATDQGMEHVSIRSAAHNSGFSVEVAREVFADQHELLTAMSQAITQRNMPADELSVHEKSTIEEVLADVAISFWRSLMSRREQQIVSYELSLFALRRTVLRSMVRDQYDQARTAAFILLTNVAAAIGISWDRPVEDLGRFVSIFIDGLSLSWLVDNDYEQAEQQMQLLVDFLVSHAVVPNVES